MDELNRRGVPLFRCDAADFPERLSVGAELLGDRWSGQLRTPRRGLVLDDVTGIYYRRPTTFEETELPIASALADALEGRSQS